MPIANSFAIDLRQPYPISAGRSLRMRQAASWKKINIIALDTYQGIVPAAASWWSPMKKHVNMTANMTAQTFTAHPLTGEMALQAYPLIQVVRGDLSLEAWTAFVQTHAWEGGDVKDKERGIIALMNSLGYLQGLFSYHVRNALAAGPVLEVENVVVMDMFKPAGAAEALRRSMQDLVCRHQCNCLHVVVDQADAWLRAYFNDSGFQMEKVQYCSRLRPDIGDHRPEVGDRTGRRGGLRLI